MTQDFVASVYSPDCIINQLRLCLVHIKYFLEKNYFSEMLFSRKENIFKCLVAL